ncbi:YlzJ-like family protein [Mesobacillus selenatarsenatis]|uniref:Ribonuclease n=1 Tax=Mesobacillus selenatarsenatis TaxID=388741 RepID=A0A846TVR4_9BACI|nr:YlzJ-like family protein [Mesobacillus selenatarsenatis]NKE06441.1 ribonuclease [Mesobacillus selenatarsenatis]
MILYTMMPHEQVFPPNEEAAVNQVMISYNGIPIMAEYTENHEYRVVRVMSTDPNHYMETSCLPGSTITLS